MCRTKMVAAVFLCPGVRTRALHSPWSQLSLCECVPSGGAGAGDVAEPVVHSQPERCRSGYDFSHCLPRDLPSTAVSNALSFTGVYETSFRLWVLLMCSFCHLTLGSCNEAPTLAVNNGFLCVTWLKVVEKCRGRRGSSRGTAEGVWREALCPRCAVPVLREDSER